MGRLYEKEMVGDKTIGYFSNGSVTRGQGVMSDTSTVVKYSNGHIYGNWMGSSLSNQIAYCDEYGNLYKGNGGGSVLAKLENGIVYDASGYGRKEIARYEGDMYGAAAAVAALMLGLANESGESSVQNETSQSTSNETGGSASSSDFNWLYMIIALPIVLIEYLLLFVWKILSFSFTSVIIAALCSLFIFDFDVFLCLIPLALNAFFLYEIREKKLISKYRGYVVAVFQNIFWVLILIPDIRQMLIRILNRYNINILGYSIPIILCVYILIPFIIALIGVRKHIKQEKLQAKNNNI